MLHTHRVLSFVAKASFSPFGSGFAGFRSGQEACSNRSAREGRTPNHRALQWQGPDWLGREQEVLVRRGRRHCWEKHQDEVKVSTYLLTDKKFSDFRLTFEFKLAKSEMHSGIAMWGRVCAEKRRPVYLRRTSGDVSIRVWLLRSLWPQHDSQQCRQGQEGSASNTTGTKWRFSPRAIGFGSC